MVTSVSLQSKSKGFFEILLLWPKIVLILTCINVQQGYGAKNSRLQSTEFERVGIFPSLDASSYA